MTTQDIRRALTGPDQDAAVSQDLLAGQGVAHRPLPQELSSVPARPAAVLAALFDDGGQAHVVLTRRSAHLRSHTGEVSFPGGRLELGEAPAAAALRETHEEVGIAPGTVEIVGSLSPLSTWSSPAAITPFVGLLSGRPGLQANPAEVERAFAVPLVELYAPDCYREELWRGADGEERAITFFELVGDTVWGATGRMLRELLDLIWVAAAPDSASTWHPDSLPES